jgi:hypothetical protein
MSFNLPYPGTPQNGQALDATPVQSNITAISQAIQSFDGSQIQAGTVSQSALATAINPVTRYSETGNNFVASGCVWSAISGFNATMTAGVVYINGIRVLVSGVVSYTASGSSDTYVDIDSNGVIYYTPVSNNANSPSLTTGRIRIAILIGTSSIVFINQGQTNTTLTNFGPTIASIPITIADSLGNLIHPYANQKIVSYRQITTAFTTTNSSPQQVTGLSAPVIAASTVLLKVSFYTRLLNNAGGAANVDVWDGNVGVTQLQEGVANGSGGPAYIVAPIVKNAGSFAFTVSLATGGAGTAGIQAASPLASFLMVEFA